MQREAGTGDTALRLHHGSQANLAHGVAVAVDEKEKFCVSRNFAHSGPNSPWLSPQPEAGAWL